MAQSGAFRDAREGRRCPKVAHDFSLLIRCGLHAGMIRIARLAPREALAMRFADYLVFV
jgi:hypothetical protein